MFILATRQNYKSRLDKFQTHDKNIKLAHIGEITSAYNFLVGELERESPDTYRINRMIILIRM
jgi:hypothetical protein